MKNSNVVPTLLVSPVFNSYVVPTLLPWRQHRDDVVAETGDSAAAPGLRCCRATLPPRATGPRRPPEPRSARALAEDAADAASNEHECAGHDLDQNKLTGIA